MIIIRRKKNLKKIKNEEIKQKEKEIKEKENEKKYMQLMKLKLRQIQEKTKDIQIFGSLINKWIYQRNELNQKRKEIFDKLYGENNDKYYDENYPKIEENINKKSYHKTFEEKLELIKNEISFFI